MNVGMIGLGKLGLPVAYAMASRGIDIYGYDPHVTEPPTSTAHEAGFSDIVEQAGDRMRFSTLDEVVANCDVIFLAVQTPHDPAYEGVTPLPDQRVDFDYSYLKAAVAGVAQAAFNQDRLQALTLSVISTVLPGTMAREVEPLIAPATLVYNPSFIAMGTTIRDFLDPEFVLLGGDTGAVDAVYLEVYGDKQPRRVYTSVRNAELIKVAYNTFIGLKIAFANTIMEVCHKTGCDVDEVTGALKQADRRLISPAYLDGGMGDGGGCHPRDNIALSWLARELDLSFDLFEAAMVCRENQADWLACEVIAQAAEHDLPVGLLGISYKPGSHLTTGSPALLVKDLIECSGYTVAVYDPYVDAAIASLEFIKQPHVYLVGTKHPEFAAMPFPAGSVVIDPFRYIPDQPGVVVIRVGQNLDPATHHRQAAEGAGVRAAAA